MIGFGYSVDAGNNIFVGLGNLECIGVGKNVGDDSDDGFVGGLDGGFVGKVGFVGCGKTTGVAGTVGEFVDIGGFVCGFVVISVGLDSLLHLGCSVGNSTGTAVITEILDATLLPLARFSLFCFNKVVATARAATMNNSRKVSAQSKVLRFLDDTVFLVDTVS